MCSCSLSILLVSVDQIVCDLHNTRFDDSTSANVSASASLSDLLRTEKNREKLDHFGYLWLNLELAWLSAMYLEKSERKMRERKGAKSKRWAQCHLPSLERLGVGTNWHDGAVGGLAAAVPMTETHVVSEDPLRGLFLSRSSGDEVFINERSAEQDTAVAVLGKTPHVGRRDVRECPWCSRA